MLEHLNRENNKKDLVHSSLGGNLVMFEYIDQLLKKDICEPEPKEQIGQSEIINFDDSEVQLSNNQIQSTEIDSHPSKNTKRKIAPSESNNQLDFKEPDANPLIDSSLTNIEKDLASVQITDELKPAVNSHGIDINPTTKETNCHLSVSSEAPLAGINEQEVTLNNQEKDASNPIEKQELESSKECNFVDDAINNAEAENASDSSEYNLRLQTGFDCVLIKIDTLLIAVPMMSLGTINTINETPTKLPGKPKWFLGVQTLDEQRSFNLIDTQDLLFSEQQKIKLKLDCQPPKFSINVFGTKWALTCDQVMGSIRVNNDQVQWRQNSNDQIIAGTIKEKMCMLINVSQLIDKIT